MNKYLIKGMTLLAVCAEFASCAKDLTPMTQEEIDNLQALKVTKTYEQAFLNYVGGSIAEDQDWGFGSTSSARTRSQASPNVLSISTPYSTEWINNYLASATEPNASNAVDNYDNSYDQAEEGYWTEAVAASFNWSENAPVNTLRYNFDNGDASGNGYTSEENKAFWTEWCKPYNDGDYSKYGVSTQAEAMPILKQKLDDTNRSSWATYTPAKDREWVVTKEAGHVADETFVLNFKITGTGDNAWTGPISVVATEGYTDGVANGNERTVVVTGKWNLTESQRVCSTGKIIVADGGEIAISSGATLEMVNQSRLVLLGSGKITGAGNIIVTNGNAAGFENYIDYDAEINITGTFNNNFGKLYNYGTFKAGTYAAGGSGNLDNGASCFYNHGLVVIDNGGVPGKYVSTNARIFNECQWYCKNDMRAYILELAGGSSFLVDGELEMSVGNDGSSDPSYVAMASGALLRSGTLKNNGTSWTGPTSGNYAVLSTGQVTYLNWAQETYPLTGGYIENNIYIQVDDMTNNPDGNNVYAEGVTMNAEWKLTNIVANGLDGGTTSRGNGNTKVISTGTTQIIAGDNNFVKGVSGCTPGFTGDIDTPTTPSTPTTPTTDDDLGTPNIRIIAEDLNATGADDSDFDFNDVVIDVYYGDAGYAKAKIVAAGGTLDLRVDGQEVHELFGAKNNADYRGIMINTNGTTSQYPGVRARSVDGAKCPVITLTKAVNSPEDARDNIAIEVYKSNTWIALTAQKGVPASKIGVDPSFTYCDERRSIKEIYTNFTSWVTGNGYLKWWE
ncbi:MAG: hypothetical protein IJ742_04540 [Prevotella sp.]|nr:hypothetical protein [Prevotella sp.]